jgi:hypothetical protein
VSRVASGLDLACGQPQLLGGRAWALLANHAAVPALDLLTGSGEARALVDSGGDLAPLIASWRDEVATFNATLDDILLYRP